MDKSVYKIYCFYSLVLQLKWKGDSVFFSDAISTSRSNVLYLTMARVENRVNGLGFK
jgi:hypothetical protein